MCKQKKSVQPEVFFEILSNYCKHHKVAKMTIEREGIEEVSGYIKEIDKDNKILRSRITLCDETGFNLSQIIAVDNIYKEGANFF